MKIIIDKEFSKLMPPLTAAEHGQLEESIVNDGCRAPLSLWRGILLDGHNCYEICQRHKIKFKTVDIKLGTRAEATIWIIRNQLGRRNLADFQKIEMVAHLEEAYAAKGKENIIKGAKHTKGMPALADPILTRKEMARLAGVSTGQYYKGKEIITKATEAEKETLRRRCSGTTINKVYADIRQRMLKAAALKLAKDRRRDKSSVGIGIDLRLGNCLEVLKTVPNQSIDLCLTDPPYALAGMDYNSFSDMDMDKVNNLVLDFVKLATQKAKITIFPSGNFSTEKKLYKEYPPQWRICWYKGACPGRSPIGFRDWEMLLVYGDKICVNQHDYFCCPGEHLGNYGHPCPKPLKWATWLVERFSPEGGLVCDAFMGSGTVGVASKQLGRRFIGIETDKTYLEIAKQRIGSTKGI